MWKGRIANPKSEPDFRFHHGPNLSGVLQSYVLIKRIPFSTMTTIQDLTHRDNIYRAWRWIRSNPDAAYKSYFRDSYTVFAVADDLLLADLRDRLRRGVFEPTNACKIYLPKPSGILRPYSLLTVEDQIAYQSAVNVIAERLAPRVRHRYNREVFGHLYAGKPSKWFYRKWSDGYAKFNTAVREAYAEGFTVSASFDLTACYDSLDHGVLRHFLQKIGCDTEFCQLFGTWLSAWTATDHGIYHNHGIPQGPLSSGLLSEVVLQHFDSNRGSEARIRYFRYVDDIRLFARSEHALRKMLVRLDKLSKDIGLFPQTGKISIHQVTDIDDELKSISTPLETVVTGPIIDQDRLRRRITALTPRFKVQNTTRFKYILGRATPNAGLTRRLWRIYEIAPEYYESIARYLVRYQRMPAVAAKRLARAIREQDLYPAILARLIQAADGRLPADDARRTDYAIKKIWKPNSLQADLLAASGRWLIKRNRLTYAQTKYACQRVKAWWPRAQLVAALDDENIGMPSYAALINDGLRDDSSEVALAAALAVVNKNVEVQPPMRTLNKSAAEFLKQFDIIRRGPPSQCGINASLSRMIADLPDVNWRALFGADYPKAERQMVLCRALSTTNVSAWVNAFDVFDDWMLVAIYRQRPGLGMYTGLASALPSVRLRAAFPRVHGLVTSVHEKRYGSPLSHARERRTGRATAPIKWNYLNQAKKLLRSAVHELSRDW